MNVTAPTTRREVDIARTAMVKALDDARDVTNCNGPGLCSRCRHCRAEHEKQAAERYPYPKVTRPRELVSSIGTRYRVVNGRLQARAPGGPWRYSALSRADRLAIVELEANPIEEVDADA